MAHSRAYRFIVLIIISLMTFPAWADPKNLFTWFRGGESTVIGSGGDSLAKYYPFGLDDNQCATLPLALSEFVFAKFGTGDPRFHLPREDIFKCYGELSPDQYRYRLELTDEGIRFLLPLTDNYSCGEEFKATFKELAPFMNKQGIKYVSQFKNSHKTKHHQP